MLISSAILPPISAPWLPPNIATHPAATQPTKGIDERVGAAAAPSLSTIPFVGWVAAGWVAMFGGNQGAEIGGNMAEDMSKEC